MVVGLLDQCQAPTFKKAHRFLKRLFMVLICTVAFHLWWPLRRQGQTGRGLPLIKKMNESYLIIYGTFGNCQQCKQAIG